MTDPNRLDGESFDDYINRLIEYEEKESAKQQKKTAEFVVHDEHKKSDFKKKNEDTSNPYDFATSIAVWNMIDFP